MIESKIIGDSACPQCRSNGGDRTENHLMHFDNGTKYCNRCGYWENKDNPSPDIPLKQPESVSKESSTSLSTIVALPSDDVPERKLRSDTLQHFKCKVEYNEQDRSISIVYSPIMSDNGKLIAYEGKAPKAGSSPFRVGESTKGVRVQLFGQSVASSYKRLWIFEGAFDAMSAWQVLSDKYPSANPSCIALRGSGNLSILSDNSDFLKQFGEVILCLDNDDAGKKATEKIYELLGNVKVWNVSFNDASEALQLGKNSELLNALFNAKPYCPSSLVIGGVGLDRLKRPLEEGIRVPSLPKTMDKLHGFREGEMTVILSPPGVGKTTLCREIGYYLIKSGQGVFNIYLEEDIEKSQQGYIARDQGVILPKLRANPELLTPDQWESAYKSLIDNDHTLWMDHFGSVQPDVLMRDIRYANDQGFKFVILDHISMVFSGMSTINERKEIDLLLTELAMFTKGANIHPIVVSHVKRVNKPLPKDGKGNVIYPYWDTVASDAARGSGAFEQLAWNIIAIEPEILESGERGRVRTKILKNREWSELGVCDTVKMDSKGKLVNAEIEI